MERVGGGLYPKMGLHIKIYVTDAEKFITNCKIKRLYYIMYVRLGYTSESCPVDIEWLCGDAEDLSAVPEDTYTAYTIAFGIRNCTHVDKVAYPTLCVLDWGYTNALFFLSREILYWP